MAAKGRYEAWMLNIDRSRKVSEKGGGFLELLGDVIERVRDRV